MTNLKLWVLILLASCLWLEAFAIHITRTTCEMMEMPVGISTGAPRFGWQLASERQGDRQTAYQVIVSSTFINAEKGNGDVWDSEKVKSDQSQFVAYSGKKLEAGQKYYWRVRVWDAKGKASDYSEVVYWQMAPDEADLNASWIGAITHEESHLPSGRNFHAPLLKRRENAELWDKVNPLAKRSIMLRKPVQVNKQIEEAVVYVSGLGHYELTINGKKVGNSEFAPLWSDYDKTVYFNTYEVNELLEQGENAIGVLLGNGMYNVTGNRYVKFRVSFGPPTLFFKMKLKYTDGTEEEMISDTSWKYAESPITFNCIFGGEDYDATLEQVGWDKPGFDDAAWKPVVRQRAPKGKLRPQLAPAIQKLKTYDIKEAKELQPGTYVLNMGQNLSGYPTIKVQGKKGQKVKLIVGESLKNDGTVGQGRSGGPHYYEYTLKGEGIEEWHPRFSYYGYQYIQVEGVDLKEAVAGSGNPVLLDIKSNFIYNSAGETGSFECSNEIFTRAYELINNAVKSNMQAVFTDCPHREKLGWIEEIHLNGPGLFMDYNLTQLIPKVMQDMADGQRDGGLVPNIVPEYVVFGGDFTDSPEWGSASVVIPWMYYQYYGDRSLLDNYYHVMSNYVDYLTSKSTNYIVSHGLGDWYDYGDHAAGYSKNSPIALSATSHYYFSADLVAKAAELTGRKDDVAKYSKLREDIRNAYNKEFFNPETKQYGTGSQFSNAISVFLGIVEPEHKQAVLDNLVADVRNRGNRLTTGDVGNRYLYQALSLNGYNDVMFDLHNHYDTPGYGFQIQFGLTTLTEQWDPRKGNSWNHFMMGQIVEWFYQTLAGIKPDMESPGFKHFEVQPETVGDLAFVNASHLSLYGEIKVSWKKESGVFTMNVKVPVNTTASIALPSVSDVSEVKVNNNSLKKSKNVKSKGVENGKVLLEVASGEYVFQYPVR